MSQPDPFGLIGQVLDGQFRVDKCVGEGGFSVVYKGHHLGLGEPIAVKCLKLPGAMGTALVESFVHRFRDESRLHYRLSQGNLYIARSIASGTTLAPATGALVPYMVLEWLEGRSLVSDLDERRARGMRGRSLEEAVRLLDSAVDALAYAHAQGVVHRDVNPGNLFIVKLRGAEKIKVLDFGVAKVMNDSTLELGPRAQTIGQIRIFSPAYGAPEQFDDRLGAVGPWTDVYALTLILLETLRDKPVVEGEHLGDYANAALDPNRRPTPLVLGIHVGEQVRKVLERAVALAPLDRWRDAGEFWGALKNAMRIEKEHVVEVAARRTPPLELPAFQRSSPAPARTMVGPLPPNAASAAAPAPEPTPMPDTPNPQTKQDPPSALPTRPFAIGPTGTIAFSSPPSAQPASPAPATFDPPTTPDSAPLEAPPPPRTLPLGARYTPPPASAADHEKAETTRRSSGNMPSATLARAPSTAPLAPAHSPSTAPLAHRASAPSFAPSPAEPEPEIPKTRSLAPILAGGAAIVALIVAVVSIVRSLGGRSGPAPHPSASASAIATVATTSMASAATTAAETTAAAVTTTTATAATSTATPTATVTATATPTATATATPTVTATGTTVATSREFDPVATKAQLDAVNAILASCKRPDGRVGRGRIAVTFATDGTTTGASVDPPFAGTKEGDCVVSRFRSAKTRPFDGPPRTVLYDFEVPK